MLTWVAVSRKIHGDPRIGRIATACGLEIDAAVGKIVRVFAEMVEEAPDGNLSGIESQTIEEWAHWADPKKRGRFAVLFRKEFCDEQGVVRKWEEYNGKAIRKANKDAQRKRDWRNNVPGDSPMDRDADSPAPLTRTGALAARVDPNPYLKEEIHPDPELFVAAVSEYPKRPEEVRRDKAFAAWALALEDGEDPHVIRAGIQRYAQFCAATKVEPRFVRSFHNFVSERQFKDPWPIPEQEPAKEHPFSVQVFQ